ncbi:MAG: MFS transporter [Gaiella sp.]
MPGPYRLLFARPHAKPLLLWALLGRLPLGVTPLGLLLLLRGEGESYAVAGAVTAAYAIAVAVGQPFAGRMVDAKGARPILLRRAIVYPTLLVGAVVLTYVDAPVAAIAFTVAAAGLALPPIAPVVRTVWPRLVPDELRGVAYTLEATLQEVFWVCGPLLAAALAFVHPSGGVLGAAAAGAIGTLALTTLGPVREAGPADRRSVRLLGALSSSGIRTMAVFAAATGFGFGTAEVAMPAFAELHGARELGGVALACFSLGSLVGGLVAGTRLRRDDLTRLLTVGPLISIGLALLVCAWSIPSLFVLAFAAGIPIAPAIAALFGVIDRIAPVGTVAEAFAWFGTSIGLGMSVGLVVGGLVIDEAGPRWAFAVAPLVAAVGALALRTRRVTLAEPAPA